MAFVAVAWLAASCGTCALTVRQPVLTCTSVVHPFILSDNRHYTFYLWRRMRLGTPVLATHCTRSNVHRLGAWYWRCSLESARDCSCCSSVRAAGAPINVLTRAQCDLGACYGPSDFVHARRLSSSPRHSSSQGTLRCPLLSRSSTYLGAISHPGPWFCTGRYCSAALLTQRL